MVKALDKRPGKFHWSLERKGTGTLRSRRQSPVLPNTLSRRKLERSRNLEQFASLRALNFAAPDTLNANALALDAATSCHLNALQVGAEGTTADAGNLGADATQVLGLTAFGVLVSFDRLLAAYVALRSHDSLRYIYLEYWPIIAQ
jgi:hypothetical protein